jgi:hypothetical protein
MSKIILKQCPFCGADAKQLAKSSSGDERNGYNFTVTIACSRCSGRVQTSSRKDSGGWCDDTGQALEAAITGWNTRKESE